ncbi:unnamed protein product [marine sediment metagenome]|uniref:Muconolactone isomerase domain-containing protein n=1 Tax=marine sediment metagenome TaxID=412755 RepID=X0UGW2_9ZZZZ
MPTLILWEMNESLIPSVPEERKKASMANLERVKEGVKAGRIKMWGISPGGNNGFSITEAEGKELFAITATWAPYVRFKIKPMISADEAIEALKGMQP